MLTQLDVGASVLTTKAASATSGSAKRRFVKFEVFFLSGHRELTFQRTVVYIVLFEDYLQACARLYNESKGKCRFVVKYRDADGQVVLKLTDDTLCFKFKSTQRSAVQQVAKINALLLTAMTSGAPIPVASPAPSAAPLAD